MNVTGNERQFAFTEQVQCLDARARHLNASAANAEAMITGLSAEVFGAHATAMGHETAVTWKGMMVTYGD